MTLSCTFGRSKSNDLYTTRQEGTTISVMTIPPVLPLSPHVHSLSWWCSLGDVGSGCGDSHCVCMGGCRGDHAAGTAPACASPLGCTLEQSNVAGPVPSLAASITAGPGQDGQCLELCICVYIHFYLHGDCSSLTQQLATKH